MKFTCESCSAQYMISDEKVAPGGVKVRCKKCGNVILVRRAAETPVAAAAAPAAAAGAPGPGLEAELGQAFDHAFGDTPPETAAPGAEQDLASTQAMGSEDAAKVFARDEAPPAATDWYVAIGQAQVGPLPLAEVKRKWEAGDVGPDSLVWRPGMADWAALTGVPELAGYLAPVPRGESRPRAAPEPVRPEPAPAPAPEVSWKPVGASALAALASEEIASRTAPEPRPEARPAATGSLVDALPDGGGVDPTGALPLNLKALEATTGEKKIERRTSVARGAAQARRRSTTRAVAIGSVLGVVLVAGAAAGGVYFYRQAAPALVAAAPTAAAEPAPAPEAPAPAPEQPAAAAAVAAAAEAPAKPEEKPEPAKPEEAKPEEAKPAPPAAAAKAAPPPAPKAAPVRKAPPRVAAAPPPKRAAPPPRRVEPPPPPPKPAPAPARKKGDPLLDFESNDAALAAALGSDPATGRSVYVPPARAGAAALPASVSPGDINGAVAQRIDALRRCVSEQKAREPDASGTLKMSWIIQGDGGVRDVRCITPEYAQGAFAQCIAGVVKTIRFPRSATTGQEVTFPFTF